MLDDRIQIPEDGAHGTHRRTGPWCNPRHRAKQRAERTSTETTSGSRRWWPAGLRRLLSAEPLSVEGMHPFEPAVLRSRYYRLARLGTLPGAALSGLGVMGLGSGNDDGFAAGLMLITVGPYLLGYGLSYGWRRRLVLDSAGLTVVGLVLTHRIPWTELEDVGRRPLSDHEGVSQVVLHTDTRSLRVRIPVSVPTEIDGLRRVLLRGRDLARPEVGPRHRPPRSRTTSHSA